MTDHSTSDPREQVIRRIRSEYLEMPGLQLTCSQARRLFGLGEHVCAALLEDLVARRFLARQPNGTYVRLTDGAVGGDSIPRGGSRTYLKRTA